MPTYLSGPINIQQGNSANFVIEFLDSSGDLTVPSTANMEVTYTNTSNNTQTDTVTLTNTNSFFTGTWSSTSAALGTATWIATMAGSTETQATGQIRVIDREAT